MEALMKRKLYLILGISILMLATMACSVNLPDINFSTVKGNGNVISENRDVSGFSGITLAGIGSLYIEQGSTESLRIEGEENLLPLIETTVTDGTLHIQFKRNTNPMPTKELNYYLTVKDLTRVGVSGLGNVEIKPIQSSNFSLDISGSGNATIDSLTAENIMIGLSGLGSAEIKAGKVTGQVINISGSGSYKAGALESKTADIEISGVGEAKVRVSERLDASISGSGSVEYIGNPNVSQQVSGVGSVKKVDE
jgi:hypothetical protein